MYAVQSSHYVKNKNKKQLNKFIHCKSYSVQNFDHNFLLSY